MMKSIYVVLIGCIFTTLGFAQTSSLSNTGSTGDFLGWDASTSLDLDIKTEAATNIGFFTDNIPRAAILSNGGLLFGVPGIQGGANISVGNQSTSGGVNIAVRGHVPAAQDITGIYGGRFSAQNGSTRSIGIRGRSYSSGSQFNYGIGAEVCNNFAGSEAIAIYGEIRPGCIGTSFALYLEGPTFSSGGEWSASDESFKFKICRADCK